MANVRIKDLTTTAATTASDDFFGVDGATNGTRKLNAFSPTFGGNLTVSGTGGLILSSSTPTVSSSATNASLNYTANGTGNHNFNNAINVNGVNGVGKLNARAETDGNLHTRAYSLINGSGTGVALDALNDANNSLTGFYIRGNAIKLGGGPVTITDNLTVSGTGNNIFNSGGGNLLIGTTTDGGQKLQVSGTAAISSTLTVGSGTNTFGVGGTTNQSTLVLNGGSSNGYGSRLELQRNGSAQSYIGTAGNILGSGDGAQSDTVIYANGSNQVRLYSGNAITLTLDSSQRCILSGALRLANTYVATPQVSTGYVTIQDSTGTTYKVLVAT